MTVPLYNLTDTWNDGGTVFTAIKMNVTDTASDATSLLMDLQIGGTSKFTINKTGAVITSGTITASSKPALSITQTWNDGGVSFTGISVDITATARANGSAIMDLMYGGVSFCQLGGYDANHGFIRIKGGAYWTSGPFNGDSFIGDGSNLSNFPTIFFNSNDKIVQVLSGTCFGWVASASDLSGAPDTILVRDAANIFAQRNSTNAQTFRVYNTYTDASNYERGVFDWKTTSNVLTIGGQWAGTGTYRQINLVGQGTVNIKNSSGTTVVGLGQDYTLGVSVWPTGVFGFAISGSPDGGTDAGMAHSAAGVVRFSDGGNNGAGWMQWAGQARVTSNFDTGNSTTLANITGLSVTVAAGRTYTFEAILYTTSNVAAGVKFAIAGTATATDIVYEAFVINANVNAAQTRASALATTVGAVTAVTAAYARITGTVTVDQAGTLTVQMAQNVGNGTGSVALRGSTFIVYDMP